MIIRNILLNLFYFILPFVIAGCQNGVFKDELPKILAIVEVKVEASKLSDEFGGFGEGYAIEVYKLSEGTVQAFLNNVSKILPDKKEKKAWQKHNWSLSPIDTAYSGVLGLVLNYRGGKKMEKQINEIRKILAKEGVYYSFYYEPDKEYPMSVQFFILDISSKNLYVLDCNI